MAADDRWGDRPDRRITTTALGAVAALSIVALAHRQQPAQGVLLAPVVLVSVHLAAVDAREHRLPNPIVGALAVLVTLGLLVAAWADGDAGRAGQAIGIGLLASAAFLVGHVIGGLGMGDVKYAYPAAATLGWFGTGPLVAGVVVMMLTGGLASIVIIARSHGHHQRLAFGPFMVIGLVAGLVVAGSAPN